MISEPSSPRRARIAAIFLSAAFIILTTWFPLRAQQPAPKTLDPLHAWNAGSDQATFEIWVNQRLAAAQTDVDKLVSVRGPRTIANTLRPYDDAFNQLLIAGYESYFMFAVGDQAPLRDKAQAMSSKVSSAITDLSLNQQVYRALATLAAPTNDPATKHYLERTLLEYRLAGVDKDDATRTKIRQLQDKITALLLTFNRNIDDDVRTVTATRENWMACPRTTLRATSPTHMESIP